MYKINLARNRAWLLLHLQYNLKCITIKKVYNNVRNIVINISETYKLKPRKGISSQIKIYALYINVIHLYIRRCVRLFLRGILYNPRI